jgi:hypothetical protein
MVTKPSDSEVQMAIENLETHKSPGIDQIPAELIKVGGRTIRSEIHKLINSIWNKEELHEQWKESIIVLIYKMGDNTDFSCECCVLSGRGLCDELVPRPEESYRLWCVSLCDQKELQTSTLKREIRSR